MEPIFEQTDENFEMIDELSFKNCPNKCRNGKYVIPYKHKKVVCDYCEDKRKRMIQTNIKDKGSNMNIEEILNLPKSFSGMNFSVDSVIPNFMLKNLEEQSVIQVKEKLRGLMQDISLGVLPSESIMFNLGSKSYENNFICPYLLRAFNVGRTTAPMISLPELCEKRNNMEQGIKSEGISYQELLEREICVIVIDAGATKNSILAVKGLMQLRANKDLATIIFTNAWGWKILDLCSEEGESSKNLATLYSVVYSEKYKEEQAKREEQFGTSTQQKTIVGMDSNSFKNLMSSQTNL